MRQYLLKSNKMRKRKQSIFDFNHIDPHIQEEELEEIKNLFRFYHKRFWCLKRAHGRFKKMNLLINLTSSGLVAIGTIAGGVTMNPIVLGVISGLGLVVKTASEMKNLKSKIEMSKFAFTTYEKTLSDLRFALRGGNFDRTEFLSSMEAIDGIVIDLGDLEMANFPSLQPGHFRLSLEFLEKVKSILHPEEWKMFWFDREDERKFEISAEELVEEWRGSEPKAPASFVGV